MTAKHTDNTVTRRKALAIGGGVVAGAGVVTAVGVNAFGSDATEEAAATAGSTSASSGQCVLMSSVTEGPYYLDGALVRKDITEGKDGVPLHLNITVQDTTDSCNPVKGAAVEIWHCDAWGYYSGYTTANPGGSAPAESEDGSTANDKTYLRGYQIAGGNGVVKFTTIMPGWYTPRTCHIHVKVHTGGEKADGTYEGGKVNYTGQLFFDDETAKSVFALEPYSQHSGSYTALDDDMVYEGGGASGGLLTLEPINKNKIEKGFTGTIVLGIDPDAENDGAGGGEGGGGEPPSGGGGGTPPSGAPTGEPPSGAPEPTASASS
ncbi:intradiol ring-cleavage dioxygenase [Streptomyces sp. NPDC052052]|uniref:intradiol ring-cleavage dioxygenase n=1 Tax=Streptomyces sp. NPDC052052 TaxID=3154756 RepID=UPI00344420CC